MTLHAGAVSTVLWAPHWGAKTGSQRPPAGQAPRLPQPGLFLSGPGPAGCSLTLSSVGSGGGFVAVTSIVI